MPREVFGAGQGGFWLLRGNGVLWFTRHPNHLILFQSLLNVIMASVRVSIVDQEDVNVVFRVGLSFLGFSNLTEMCTKYVNGEVQNPRD